MRVHIEHRREGREWRWSAERRAGDDACGESAVANRRDAFCAHVHESRRSLLVRPDLGKHSSTDYSGFDELIEKGYEATKAAIPEIRRALEAKGVVDLSPRKRPSPGRPHW